MNIRRAIIYWTTAFLAPVVTTLFMAGRILAECRHLDRDAEQARQASETAAAQLQASERRTHLLEARMNEVRLKEQEAEKKLSPDQRRWAAVLRRLSDSVGAPDKKAAAAGANFASAYDTVGRPYFRVLLADPDYAKAAAVLVRERVNTKFARLYTMLDLPPEAQENLEKYLTEKEMAGEDALALMGKNSEVADRLAALSDTRGGIDREIAATLGPDVLQQVRTFDGVSRYYNIADELETRASYTTDPLTSAQADQFVEVMRQTVGLRGGTQYWEIPDAAIAELKLTLPPAQIDAIQEIRQEQAVAIAARNKRVEKSSH